MKKMKQAPGQDENQYDPVNRKNFGTERIGSEYPKMFEPVDPNKDGFTTMPFPDKDENVDPNPIKEDSAGKSWNETRPKAESQGKS